MKLGTEAKINKRNFIIKLDLPHGSILEKHNSSIAHLSTKNRGKLFQNKGNIYINESLCGH